MSTLSLLAGILQNIAAMRPMQLLVWASLVAASVFLVVSIRSRWGRSRPLYRCAALSLLVHFILIGVAMTVRLVVGDGGSGAGPPIRVRVIEELAEQGPVDPVEPPPLLEVEAKLASEEPVPAVETKAEVLAMEAPPLMDAPVEVAEMAAEALPLIEEIAQDAPATEAVALPIDSPPTVEPPEVANTSPADVPTITEVATVASSPYSRRNAAERLHWAEQQGGSRQTEAAVAAALAWLAKAQSADGRWDARQYGAGVEMAVLGQNRNGAGADADPGISALALLAFLGAGHTHQSGDYQRNVHNGLNFLAYGQAADGNLAPATGLYAQMYCHSMATFALAEAMAMTNDRRLEPVVQRAVNFCLRAQHPSTGGWRYRIGDLGDTSQLGWQLMALWSADNAGIRIPPQTWTGAERFLRSVRRGRYGGLASYRPDGPASTPMTAEALYCRHLLSDTIAGPRDWAAMNEGTTQLLATLPETSQINLYYWYYATLALHHQQQSSDANAQAWQTWNGALTTVLLDTQQNDGSWNPSCIWGGYGGRVYTTAIATLCLEVYYRYAPVPSHGDWTASRPDAAPAGPPQAR